MSLEVDDLVARANRVFDERIAAGARPRRTDDRPAQQPPPTPATGQVVAIWNGEPLDLPALQVRLVRAVTDVVEKRTDRTWAETNAATVVRNLSEMILLLMLRGTVDPERARLLLATLRGEAAGGPVVVHVTNEHPITVPPPSGDVEVEATKTGFKLKRAKKD